MLLKPGLKRIPEALDTLNVLHLLVIKRAPSALCFSGQSESEADGKRTSGGDLEGAVKSSKSSLPLSHFRAFTHPCATLNSCQAEYTLKRVLSFLSETAG